jgi:ubiquinone biosynthesis protein UbiJ
MEKKQQLEMLYRKLNRLITNFDEMVIGSEEADMMLDWINEIRRRIAKLEKELDN